MTTKLDMIVCYDILRSVANMVKLI